MQNALVTCWLTILHDYSNLCSHVQYCFMGKHSSRFRGYFYHFFLPPLLPRTFMAESGQNPYLSRIFLISTCADGGGCHEARVAI